MNDIFKFSNGDKVREIVSGAEGVIVTRCELMSGNIKYCVRPQNTKDGKPSDSFWMDEGQCEVLEAGAVKGPMEPRSFRFHLGDKVKDRYSDLEGILTSRCDHMFGCHRYDVSPSKLTDTFKPGDGANIDENAVIVLEEAAAPAKKDAKDRPGAMGDFSCAPSREPS